MRRQVVERITGSRFETSVRSVHALYRDHIPTRLLSGPERYARRYDRWTVEIARLALRKSPNSIDVGAHLGSILKHFVRMAPDGRHFAFEPIPTMANHLARKYPKVAVRQVALADYDGVAEFNFLPGAAAYSSLIVRPAVNDGQVVKKLSVDVRRLDDCIPRDVRIGILKIDVEGAELAVLKGASELLARDLPITVFECASRRLHECIPTFDDAGLRVSFLDDYLSGRMRSTEEVVELGAARGEYYYVASPR